MINLRISKIDIFIREERSNRSGRRGETVDAWASEAHFLLEVGVQIPSPALKLKF